MDNDELKTDIFSEDHLEHHGILGQRWGYRRFQNPDGSLTEAGMKRYNRQTKKLSRLEKKADRKEKSADRYGDRPWIARNRGTHSDKVIRAKKARRNYDKYRDHLIKEYGDVTLRDIREAKQS